MNAAINSPRFRRTAGMLLVLVYLLAVPGIAPMALGMLGHVVHHHDHEDNDHDVQIAMVDGHFELVLHHDHEDDDALSVQAPETAVPCLTDDDDDHSHGDHVFQFRSSSPLPSSGAAKALASQTSLAALSWSGVSMPSMWSHTTRDKLLRGRPPPGGLALVTILRTTVFLV